MAKSAATIKRKLWVCARNKCSRCTNLIGVVPECCKLAILHVLDSDELGMFERPRRSGKTTKLVGIANEMVEAGMPVTVVTINNRMKEMLYERYELDSRVRVFSAMSGTVQRDEAYLLSDEVLPSEWDEFVVNRFPRGRFALGYYSNR